MSTFSLFFARGTDKSLPLVEGVGVAGVGGVKLILVMPSSGENKELFSLMFFSLAKASSCRSLTYSFAILSNVLWICLCPLQIWCQVF